MRISKTTGRSRVDGNRSSATAATGYGFTSLERGTGENDSEQRPGVASAARDSSRISLTNTTGSIASRRGGGPSNKTDDGDTIPEVAARTVVGGYYDETISQTRQSPSIILDARRTRREQRDHRETTTSSETTHTPPTVSSKDNSMARLPSRGLLPYASEEEQREAYADIEGQQEGLYHDEKQQEDLAVAQNEQHHNFSDATHGEDDGGQPEPGAQRIPGPGARDDQTGEEPTILVPISNHDAAPVEDSPREQDCAPLLEGRLVEHDDRTELLDRIQRMEEEAEQMRMAVTEEMERIRQSVEEQRNAPLVHAEQVGQEQEDALADDVEAASFSDTTENQELPEESSADAMGSSRRIGSEDDDDDKFLGRAHQWIRRHRLFCILTTVVVLIGAIVGIAVGVSSSQSKGGGEPSSVDSSSTAAPIPITNPPTISTHQPTPPPTRSPTPRPSFRPTQTPTIDVIESTTALIQANALDGGASLNNPSSPQYQAFQWLLGNSKLSTYSNRRKLQRYSLATLYYSTNGVGWTNSTVWLSNSHECDWWSDTSEGLLCSDGEFVSNLDLDTGSGNNLVGTLPRELAFLSTSIVRMELENDSLSGSIPSEIGVLTCLEILWMGKNDLSSAIPSELGLLTKVESLSLWNNELTGAIPSDLSGMTNLKGLFLDFNKLTGTIPSEINEMTNLDELHLYENHLSPPFTCPSFIQHCYVSCDDRFAGFDSNCRKLQ